MDASSLKTLSLTELEIKYLQSQHKNLAFPALITHDQTAWQLPNHLLDAYVRRGCLQHIQEQNIPAGTPNVAWTVYCILIVASIAVESGFKLVYAGGVC